MSLDVYLWLDGEEVHSSNITHNLAPMAKAAGIYEHLWRPDEIGVTHARDLIEPLRTGLAKLITEYESMQQYNASNGWGRWENFVPWVTTYWLACINNPDATVRAWR